MILERAEILIREGLEEDFAAAMKERGITLLASGKGCHSVRLARGVENPGKFILLVEWTSVEAHTDHAKTPIHAAFREVIAPFATGGTMEHFDET
jgi:quinol monooxygenase YgiN